MAKTLTGMTPQREQRLTEILVDRIAANTEPKLRKEIRRAMIDYADAYGNDIFVSQAVEKHKKNITDIMLGLWKTTFTNFGRRMLAGYKRFDPREAAKSMDVYDQLFTNFLAVYGSLKVTQITGTTQEQAIRVINRVIEQAQLDGLDETQSAKLLTSTMRTEGGVLSSYRAAMISRTESHSAAMQSNFTAAKATGLDMKKEWVAAKNERTRVDHADADGQIVAMDEPFIVGGEPLMMPGDPNGSAGNIINCRCVAAYVFPE